MPVALRAGVQAHLAGSARASKMLLDEPQLPAAAATTPAARRSLVSRLSWTGAAKTPATGKHEAVSSAQRG